MAPTLGLAFLSPALAIAGAACVAVPIIIHLLTRQRRRPIPWAAMKFLIEAYKKHRRRLTLEQLLLLACRCLIVLCVGLALGRPILGDLAASRGPVQLYLLVDNSLLSQLRDTGGSPEGAAATPDGATALDRFKEHAARMLGELDASRGDRAAVIALGSPAESIILPPSSDLGAVARVLADMPATESRADLAGAIGMLRAHLAGPDRNAGSAADDGAKGTARAVIAVLSDLRAGSTDLAQQLPSLGLGSAAPRIITLSPASDGVDNIAITAIEPLRPLLMQGGPASDPGAAASPGGNQVRVSLRRFGPGVSRALTTPVKLGIAGAQAAGVLPANAAEGIVQWQQGQETASATINVSEPPSDNSTTLALIARIDADALPSDDLFVRPIEARRAVRIALVESLKLASGAAGSIDRFTPGDWIRLVLQPDAFGAGPLRPASSSGLAPTTIDPASVARSGLSGFDAAIVLAPDELGDEGWRRLAEFSRAGGLLVITPPAAATVHVWGDALAKALGLEWAIGREPAVYNPTIGLASEAPGGTSNPLLGLLAAELPALAKPVSIARSLPIIAAGDAMVPILNLESGAPLVLASPSMLAEPTTKDSAGSAAPASRGTIVLFTAAIDLGWMDLPTKPLMLPLLHEIVRLGIGRSQSSFDSLAGGPVRSPIGTDELEPADPRSQRLGRITGAAAQGASGAIREAGVWRAVGRRGSTLSLVAVNADTTASNTLPTPAPQARVWLSTVSGEDRLAVVDQAGAVTGDAPESAASSVRAGGEDREPISMPLLVSALALALVEVFLARRFSHASVGAAATAGAGGSSA